MSTPAGIWVRVSTADQTEASQVPDIERYCAAHDYDIVKRYELNDRSAFHGEQEAYQREALADTRAGTIKVLVVWASDRLERRGAEATLRIFRKFREAGGRAESVQESFLNSEDPELMLAITGWKDRQESKRKSERVVAKLDALKQQGSLIGRPPFGYMVEGVKGAKQLVPTDQGRALVPEVYRRVIGGDPLPDIAEWLINETGRPWYARTVAGLVRNPVYRGQRCELGKDHRYGRVIHKCEPLVGADVWKRASDNLAKRPKRGKVYAEKRAMLSGVLFCPKCGGPMYRIKVGHGGAFYYRCAGKGTARRRSECRNMVQVRLVDGAVDTIAKRTFYRPVMTERLVPGHDHGAELAQVQFDMQQLALADLADDEYDAKLAGLRRERDRLRSLPSEPDRVELVPTGEKYRDLWEATPAHERGPWLARHGFRVYADRSMVRMEQGTRGVLGWSAAQVALDGGEVEVDPLAA
jgi:DNA invertase Pin-like site-specific DNA recombinase